MSNRNIDPRRSQLRPGARRYRAELLDRGRVVPGQQVPTALVLDFTPGAWSVDARAQLDGALRSMLAAAGVPPRKHLGHALLISDWDTGDPLFEHPVSWNPDDLLDPAR